MSKTTTERLLWYLRERDQLLVCPFKKKHPVGKTGQKIGSRQLLQLIFKFFDVAYILETFAE